MKSLLGVTIFAVFFVLLVHYASPCAVDYEIPIFAYHRHPDFPRTEFLNGRLGVLQPTYARSYLYVAYRYLSGLGLNPAEREQVRLYWNDRLSGDWDNIEIDWAGRWRRARRNVSGGGNSPKMAESPQFDTPAAMYDERTHFWLLNCADDAFRTAIVTLRDRSYRYGRNNPFVKEWLRGQDAVFSNCFTKGDFFPTPVPVGAPAWLRADRAYQLAAAQLYTNHSREAEAGFRQIASDPSSPWRWIAPYLVGRVLARQAEASGATKASPAERDALYEKARAHLEGILADQRLAPIHGMSSALLRRIRVRVRPQVAIHELARDVMHRGDEGSLRQDLSDYTTLLDHFLDWRWGPVGRPEFAKEAATLPRQDDVTDWIATFQSKQPWDVGHAIKRWRDTGRLQWLIAALSGVSGGNPAVRDLVEASLAIPADSRAFWTAAYHRCRLRLQSGDRSGARVELDEIIDHKAEGPGKSAMNQFRALRMLAAPDLAGFLTFAQRVPVQVTSEINTGELPDYYADRPGNQDTSAKRRWDPDAIKVLNDRTPLALWIAASRSDSIAENSRQELVLATFARATLLADDSAIRDVAADVTRVFPGASKYMSELVSESTIEGRHFAAVYFLLHHANIRPYMTLGMNWRTPSIQRMDSFFYNWWCSLDAPHELDWDTNRSNQMRIPQHRTDPDLTGGGVAFLQADEIAQGKKEFERLVSTGPAPNYFGAEILKWANTHPDDPRIPEALAYEVRAGKYGCTDAESWKFSRDAHALLHAAYGLSPWARQTPYWYKTWIPRDPW